MATTFDPFSSRVNGACFVIRPKPFYLLLFFFLYLFIFLLFVSFFHFLELFFSQFLKSLLRARRGARMEQREKKKLLQAVLDVNI